MKLDPEFYRDAAINWLNGTNRYPVYFHCTSIYISYMRSWFDSRIFTERSSDEEFATALLFMAHITEDENETK